MDKTLYLKVNTDKLLENIKQIKEKLLEINDLAKQKEIELILDIKVTLEG